MDEMRGRTIIYLACTAVLLLGPPAVSQVTDKNPARAPEPEMQVLRDGVYLSYAEARNNEPGLVLEDLFKSFYDSVFTIYQWAHTPKLYYIGPEGRRISLSRDSIWGFSEKGNVYLCMNGYFHKVSLFGAIFLFREYYPLPRDPLSVVITDKQGEVRDRIYDFSTGRVGDFDLDNVAALLLRDEGLFAEFDRIPTAKEKQKQMYRFVERFNDRHPPFESHEPAPE